MYRFDKMFSRNNCMIPLLSTCLIKCPSRNHAIPIPSWNVEQRDDDDTSAASPLRFPTQKQSINKINFLSCWVWFNNINLGLCVIINSVTSQGCVLARIGGERYDIHPVYMEEFDKTTIQWNCFTTFNLNGSPQFFLHQRWL